MTSSNARRDAVPRREFPRLVWGVKEVLHIRKRFNNYKNETSHKSSWGSLHYSFTVRACSVGWNPALQATPPPEPKLWLSGAGIKKTPQILS